MKAFAVGQPSTGSVVELKSSNKALSVTRPPQAKLARRQARPTVCAATVPPQERVLAGLENVSYVVGGITVFENISLELRQNEIVCILGPSGSGKSTLMRMVAGLTTPTSGRAMYHDREFAGANPGAAIVFQTFALYPWLTVLENVEIGLSVGSQTKAERHRRAMKVIDIIGLDGYENAFPKELSGGMRQRVGFARALAVEPEILCMDEPFSALDVLTAENLRSELLRLWQMGELSTKSILIVTHGIEEAVSLADRLIILGRDPGCVRANFPVTMEHPRDRKSNDFQRIVDRVYKIISRATRPDEEIEEDSGISLEVLPSPTPTSDEMSDPKDDYSFMTEPVVSASMSSPLDQSTEPTQDETPRYPLLPGVRVASVAGFLAFMEVDEEIVDLYKLGSQLQLDVDDLYPIVDAACILGLIRLQEGDVFMAEEGREFLDSGIDEKKEMVRDALLKKPDARLIQQITYLLTQAHGHRLPQELLFDAILLKHFSPQEARRQLEIAIEWGRFAELFGYDAPSSTLFLDENYTPASMALSNEN